MVEANASTSADPVQSRFDPAAIRRRYAAAFRPRPAIYWIDMLVSALVGWSAFAFAVEQPLGSLPWLLATGIAIFALLRGVLFIHEIAHFKSGTMRGFEGVWHAILGLPLMLPSLMYVGSHNDHHKRVAFGTLADPEYAPIAKWSRLRIVRFVLGVALVPLVLPFRWGVLGPLSYLIPPLRRIAVERASTLVINPEYRRPMPQGRHVRWWLVQEAFACLAFWLAVALVAMGVIQVTWLVTWYVVSTGILVVNQVRTLAAHGYENEGQRLDTTGQLMDSINLSGSVLTTLVAPVGLRYHALHHFVPTVPYHSLGMLHRQLLAELPREAPYRRTERAGVLLTVRDLWEKAPA